MDSISPKISVVMTVFNGEKFLAVAIESILRQSFTDFEFIIIDDGSTDNSFQIQKKFQSLDNRIIIHKQEKNQGVVAARNKGLALARAKYLAIMDSDDYSLPHRLETQFRFLESHPGIDVLGSNVLLINSEGKITSNFINTTKLPQTSNEIRWSFCYECTLVNPVVMYRTDIVRQAGGYNPASNFSEDYELWTRMAHNVEFYNLEDVLLHLRRHESNFTIKHLENNMHNACDASRKYISSILHREIPLNIIETLWYADRKQSQEILDALQLIEEINSIFCRDNSLSSNEKQYIKRDTANRLLDLLFREISINLKLQIFIKACRYSFVSSFARLFLTIARRGWKLLKAGLH